MTRNFGTQRRPRIVQQTSRDSSLDADIVVCPIVRESARIGVESEKRLSQCGRAASGDSIIRALAGRAGRVANGVRVSSLRLQETTHSVLSSEPPARVDHAEIVDAGNASSLSREWHTELRAISRASGEDAPQIHNPAHGTRRRRNTDGIGLADAERGLSE